MLRSALRSRRLAAPARLSVRQLSTSSLADKKVTVVGAAGGIGQPLSLLLKAQPTIGELALFDIAPVTKGVAADLSHIPSPAKVTGFVGQEELEASLQDADVVVIPAGVPRKPGMTRDDLFNMNASIVANTIQACANVCPEAALCIISNPVNSTVPIAAEVLKKNGVYNPTKLFGVTTLDVCRAETFFAESAGIPVDDVINEIDVIGGHAGKTILPLFSKVAAEYDFDESKIDALTNRTMFGGDEVVQAKDGAGSATLSMALAGARFTENVIAGLNGEKRRVVAFVDNPAAPTDYFSSPFVLGPDGAENFDDFPLQGLSAYEEKVLAEMLPELEAQIKKGVDFVANME